MTTTSLLSPRPPQAPAMHRESAFEALQREIDHVFDGFIRGFPSPVAPGAECSMDVIESDKDIEITCELPGLEQKDVQISVDDHLLTVSGEKKVEREDKTKAYRLVERSVGRFRRQIPLPSGFDPAAINAVMSNGVLKITIPKPANKTPKRIEIRSAA